MVSASVEEMYVNSTEALCTSYVTLHPMNFQPSTIDTGVRHGPCITGYDIIISQPWSSAEREGSPDYESSLETLHYVIVIVALIPQCIIPLRFPKSSTVVLLPTLSVTPSVSYVRARYRPTDLAYCMKAHNNQQPTTTNNNSNVVEVWGKGIYLLPSIIYARLTQGFPSN